jgi:hypothetical protein
MKASELEIGAVAVATNGTGYMRTAKRVVKVKVVGEPKGGRVRVELLEDSHDGVGYRQWGMNAENPVEAGKTITLRTKDLWMPWETFETRLGNEREQQEQERREEELREEHLTAIQSRARVDRAVPDIKARTKDVAGVQNGLLRWGGLAHNYGVETHVKIPTVVLEALLDSVEP